MRKFSAIQNACGWSVIYRQGIDLFGKEETDRIFDKALKLTGKYCKNSCNSSGINKIHIQGAIAAGSLYLPLKEKVGYETASKMLEEGAKPVALAKHDKIEKFPSWLFMKIVYVITSIMFGEKAGFKRRWHCNTSKERRFDLLSCPYVEVLKRMGCPEVCPVICIQDDYSFSNMKNGVLFERTKTLGRGDDCCDFCYRIPGKENLQ